jgi:hypothetical protein
MAPVTIAAGGQELTLAPLKSRQVAAFFDANDPNAKQSAVVDLSLRVIAQSLQNANDPFAQGVSSDELPAKIDDAFSWREVNEAFVAVLDVTGLKKAPEGEAPAAADSTSSESTAA